MLVACLCPMCVLTRKPITVLPLSKAFNLRFALGKLFCDWCTVCLPNVLVLNNVCDSSRRETYPVPPCPDSVFASACIC